MLAFLFSIPTAFSQEYTSTNKKALSAYENAQSAFNARNYELVLAYVDEAVDRDPQFIEAFLLKFEAYVEMDDLANAEMALEDALAINPDFFRNAWYFLAEIEMEFGKYHEAEPHYKKFLTYRNLNPDFVEWTNLQIKKCNYAIVAKQKPVPFEPLNMGEAINSPMPEYYPTVTADDQSFIFTRLIDDNRSFQGKNENFYQSNKRDGSWFPAFPLSEINTEYNEGAPAISGDGQTLVFTGCELMGEYGAGRTGYGSCDLFVSENVGGVWTTPVNLGEPINSRYWETQPSLSADGMELYFLRGLPSRGEGMKEQDIYMARKRKDGTWTDPKRLTSKINTKFREESVLIHPDGKTLYFSSEGHPGMGGLDLYVSTKDDSGRWQTPVNLGYPINTHTDENSLLVGADGQIAYFASDREGGFGDMDLYKFDLHEGVRAVPVTYAKGRIKDADTGEPVVADIRLTDLNNRNFKKHFRSNKSSGEFTIALNAGDHYGATVIAPGYLIHSEAFTVPDASNFKAYAVDVELHKVKEGSTVILQNIYFGVDSDSLTQHSVPELRELGAFLEANPELVVEIGGHTDNTGDAEYNKELSLRRAEAVKEYIVLRQGIEPERIKTKGYGADKPVSSNDTEEGKAENRRTEFKIVGMI